MSEPFADPVPGSRPGMGEDTPVQPRVTEAAAWEIEPSDDDTLHLRVLDENGEGLSIPLVGDLADALTEIVTGAALVSQPVHRLGQPAGPDYDDYEYDYDDERRRGGYSRLTGWPQVDAWLDGLTRQQKLSMGAATIVVLILIYMLTR